MNNAKLQAIAAKSAENLIALFADGSDAIAQGIAAAAEEALKNAQPELMRGVSKGILHKNTASRKVSRLASRVKTLAGTKA